MDWQYAFNTVFGIASVAIGWVMKVVHDELKDHGKELQALPSLYARRDDVREMKQEILHTLSRIENKVDQKH